MEHNYEDWLKLVKYELASLRSGSLRGANNTIEEYGDITKYHLEKVSPENLANKIHKHFEDIWNNKKQKEKEDRARMQTRMRKTFEKIESRCKDNKVVVPEKTLEYQLGYYIGDYIYYKHLPTLSPWLMQSPTLIQVSEEDTAKYNELSNACTGVDNEAWKEYRAFNKSLEEKYMPPVLECFTRKITSITNMEELISGIRSSLWNCDVCCYNLDTIKVENDGDFFTKIIISLR